MLAQIERVRRLKRRDGVLVDQLHLPFPLEQDGELVEAGHLPLKHDAVHEKQGHGRLLVGSRGEENVLQACARCCFGDGRQVRRRTLRHDRRDRMLVDQLRRELAAQEQGKGVKPGNYALKFYTFHKKDDRRRL